MEPLNETDLDDKIARMELKLAGMNKQMRAMPAGSKLRDDAWKVIKNYELDMEQVKKMRIRKE